MRRRNHWKRGGMKTEEEWEEEINRVRRRRRRENFSRRRSRGMDRKWFSSWEKLKENKRLISEKARKESTKRTRKVGRITVFFIMKKKQLLLLLYLSIGNFRPKETGQRFLKWNSRRKREQKWNFWWRMWKRKMTSRVIKMKWLTTTQYKPKNKYQHSVLKLNIRTHAHSVQIGLKIWKPTLKNLYFLHFFKDIFSENKLLSRLELPFLNLFILFIDK